MKRLIITADDFGLTPGVSRGIVEAVESGVVRSTSAMLCIGETGRELKQWRSVLNNRTGVHLQLMDGSPCANAARVPSLTDEHGRFPTSPMAAGGMSPAEVREEWHAQVERLLELDFEPTHLDTHNHVHMTPGILDVYCEIALHYGLRARAGTPNFMAKLKARGVSCVDYCDISGPENRGTVKAFLECVARAFAACGEAGVVEIVCHPGYVDASLKEKSFYVDERKRELDVLCSAEVRDGLERMGVRVVDGFEM